MRLVHILPSLLLLALGPAATAQQPPPGEVPAKSTVTAKPVDVGAAWQRALVTGEPAALSEAVEELFKAGPQGRARLRTVADRVAPAAEALPPMETGAKPDPKTATEPLDDETKALVADLLSEDATKGEAAAGKLKLAATSATDQARKVVLRSNAVLSSLIRRTFRDQGESNAIFAGQYAMLKDLGPHALQVVTTWITTSPVGAGAAGLRVQSIKAIRDLLDGKPDEKLAKALAAIAGGAGGDANVKREAKYALAQFGDRSFLDPEITRLEAKRASEDVGSKGAALGELADIYYQLRDYEHAVEAFEQHIALIEAGKLARTSVQSIPTLYYNACCSMALGGMLDKAFVYLEKAIEEGRKGQPLGRRLLEIDMDIDALRKDPRFEKIMASFGARK